jgi:hypothetical protein
MATWQAVSQHMKAIGQGKRRTYEKQPFWQQAFVLREEGLDCAD